MVLAAHGSRVLKDTLLWKNICWSGAEAERIKGWGKRNELAALARCWFGLLSPCSCSDRQHYTFALSPSKIKNQNKQARHKVTDKGGLQNDRCRKFGFPQMHACEESAHTCWQEGLLMPFREAQKPLSQRAPHLHPRDYEQSTPHSSVHLLCGFRLLPRPQ